MSGSDCIFCGIVGGRLPAHTVYEDESTLVFMDIFPVADGHTLLIPKRHGKDLFETEPDDLASLIRTSRRVAEALQKVIEPEGIMVFQLNGAAAGQTVYHYHMHLLPRWSDQPLTLHTRTPGDPARLAELAAKLAAALQ